MLGLSDLSSAFSNQGLKELKKHINGLERFHHSSQLETHSTKSSRIEVIHEGKELDNILPPFEVSVIGV